MCPNRGSKKKKKSTKEQEAILSTYRKKIFLERLSKGHMESSPGKIEASIIPK